MPAKTKRDEEKWSKAKGIAKEKGRGDDYAYIMGIYKRMKPDYFKDKEAVGPREIATRLREIADRIDASKQPHASAVREELRSVVGALPSRRTMFKKVVKQEAGRTIQKAYLDAIKAAMGYVADKVVALESFRQMADSIDMTKDALLAMEQVGVLPELDSAAAEDIFHILRSAVDQRMRKYW